MNKREAIIVGGIAVSFWMGAAGGYFLAIKRLETKYAEILDKEIAETKAFYAKINKDEYPTPEAAVSALVEPAAEALLEYRGEGPDAVVVAEEVTTITKESYVGEVITNNVFGEENADLNIEARTEDKPYVISLVEYMQNEEGYDQIEVTFYAGDNTLADERDKEIPDVDSMVGHENLQKFGVGSTDANVVLVRNERLKMDFTVLHSDGSFAHEVLGFEHSDETFERRPRRRGADE